MFGSVAPILDKDDDESPYGDAFKVKYEDNVFFDASISKFIFYRLLTFLVLIDSPMLSSILNE